MNYLSVCSGIEAASVAWRPFGWHPHAFSEIDAFPSSVLAHHYPDVPNLGDMTQFKEWDDAAIDLLVGGTPCQSFSVAGLRKGLADPRGNLSLVYLGIAARYRPEWVLWENVPGVLSSSGGRDFGAFLGGLAELGYGWAYRVLDAQYVRVDGFGRAVPQRRRRVFVVGNLGGWRRAAAVLFEPESLSGNPPPRREAGKGITRSVAPSLTSGGRSDGAADSRGQDAVIAVPEISHALNAGAMGRQDFETETLVIGTLNSSSGHAYLGQTVQDATAGMLIPVSHALRADGFDASEDGTGRGTPIVPIAFDCKAGANTGFAIGDVPGPLRGEGHGGGHAAVAGPIRSNVRSNSNPITEAAMHIISGWGVRRLTPTECERLQAFPDGYTAIPFRKKIAADGPRYKALGNSMSVNVMRWLGQRIALVNSLS